MSQSLVKNMIHLVFSTKHRAPMIPVEIQPKLWAFQAGVFNNWNSFCIATKSISMSGICGVETVTHLTI